MGNGAKRFPCSWPELAYILLMIALPLGLVWLWPASSIPGVVMRLVLGWLGAFALWLAIVAAGLGLQQIKKRRKERI